MRRIAIGGLGHETNSFAPGETPLRQFLDAGEMPALKSGRSLIEDLRPLNFAMSGFIGAMEEHHKLLPLVWAQGGAGPVVADEAFDWFATTIREKLAELGPIDALYLDLHGAMVTHQFDDAEGELLTRLRRQMGDQIPIIISMDYHGNLTQRMLDAVDGLAAYRTYPHIDREETGRRAAAILDQVFRRGRPPYKVLRRAPFLIPLPFESTDRDPSHTLVQSAAEPLHHDVLALEYTAGFPASDVPECGPTVATIGYDSGLTDATNHRLFDRLIAAEPHFPEPVLAPEEAVVEAIKLSTTASRPIILADTQDNPGGGGSGDTTDLLKELIKASARKAALAIMIDPDAAAAAHGAGEGTSISLSLGGKHGPASVTPLSATYEVRRLTDGRFRSTGSTFGGRQIDLGPSAVLRLHDIDILVASRRMQPYDPSIFHHFGLDPTTYNLLVLKSSVHFRADFGPIAERILLVRANGWHLLDLTSYPYRKLPPGVRLGPCGPAFA